MFGRDELLCECLSLEKIETERDKVYGDHPQQLRQRKQASEHMMCEMTATIVLSLATPPSYREQREDEVVERLTPGRLAKTERRTEQARACQW